MKRIDELNLNEQVKAMQDFVKSEQEQGHDPSHTFEEFLETSRANHWFYNEEGELAENQNVFVLRESDLETPGAEQILRALEGKLNLFQQAKTPIHFTAVKRRSGEDFSLHSDPLPKNLMGIWAYAIFNAKVAIDCSVKDGTTLFSVDFRYEMRRGGSNGTSIADVAEHELLGNFDHGKGTVTLRSDTQRIIRAIRKAEDAINIFKPELTTIQSPSLEDARDFLADYARDNQGSGKPLNSEMARHLVQHLNTLYDVLLPLKNEIYSFDEIGDIPILVEDLEYFIDIKQR